MNLDKPYYADAQAFLGFPGQAPRIEKDLLLDLALVTCAPPVGPCADSLEATIAACAQFKNQLGEIGAQRIRIVTRASQIDTEDERLHIVLGLQNLPGDIGREDLDWYKMREAGIRVIGLAYDTINPFGSGCLNLDMGLTDAGEDVLCRMQDHGMILDLSHASHRMARQMLEVMDKRSIDIPVMASHGGCYAVYPHFRNLPDDVLAGIAKRGGVVGIANLTFILDRESDGVDAFRRHLKHAVEVCGPRAVVIGSDAPYVTYTAEEEKELFGKMKGMIDPDGTWDARYPMYTPELAGPQKMQKMADPPVPGVLQLGLNLKNFFKRSLPK